MSGWQRTPLFPVYEKYGAKTVNFGGFEMPVQFSGIQKEHRAVREKAGLFDVSHMGEFRVTGADAADYLQFLTTNDVSKLTDGQTQYTLMCYPDGGTVDDLLVYRFARDHFMLVVNAANRQKDLEWLEKHRKGDVLLEDISDDTALLALQGPLAETVLQQVTPVNLSELSPFHFVPDAKVGDTTAVVSRTGYTGEDGFELYLPAEDAISLWEQLLTVGEPHGVVPAGLGARDTLRFEARLPLYGQELSPSITPVEAGLGFAVKPDKGEFVGRDVLAAQKAEGPPRRIVGLEMIERGIPRSGYGVFAGKEKIGEITTGTQSPTLKKNVGLALIKSEYAETGRELTVDIRGRHLRARVVKTPFYKR